MKDLNLEKLLQWRCIGPFRGGRVVTVAGDPSNPATFYFGACAGGVWKTTDGGTYWECVSDGFFNTGSVGALAVAHSDPNVIYAGTGETTIRIDVSHGDGVYKSTDAGRSWSHMGLEDTRHIGKIAIHPENPDIVYVAALGHAHGNNPERGVYRTIDGGKNWELVLHKSEKAGAVDIKLDPNNPRILYASIWEAYRNFWQISSGGPDSGIWRSMDGGDTWQELTAKGGLPEGLYGKTGVAPSPAQSGRVWALCETANDPGLYRSDDYGDTWKRVSDDGNLYGRSWYYVHVNADPVDANTVWVNCFSMWRSIDGGENFTEMATPHGDCHDIWIDPVDNSRMIQANDGGACISYNKGASWSSIFNQPTAQFYHICTDNQYPYHVYGTQQDNSSLAIPSVSERGAIPWAAIYQAGTGESGYIAVRPDDHNVVFVGAIGSSPGGGSSLQRYDHRTKQIRLIANWPESNWGNGAIDDKYRFNWTYPIVISPHDPNILYVGGNQVLKTTDEGQTWTTISPDLTRNDVEKLQPTGGPINRDSIGAETYCTVYSLVESQHEAGVIWAGTDDGLIQLTKDGGESWTDVTPAELPEWSMINMIEQSPHDAATVYVAATRYKLDDYEPYIYKTTDYGATWSRINDGFRADDYTRVVRCDPTREGLLYAGTETGVYVSFDDGENWNAFNLNLPTSPVYDLIIKDNDLIAGTHGRSIWILDDITPLHQLSDEISGKKAHLFKPRDTWRAMHHLFEDWGGGAPGKNYTSTFTEITTFVETKSDENEVTRNFLDVGTNPPNGAIIGYYLDAPAGSLSLQFLDANGTEVAEFGNKPSGDDLSEEVKAELDSKRYAPNYAGMNRFIWNMRHADGVKLKGKEMSAVPARGPMIAPGTYQVRLSVNGSVVQTHSFVVKKDPRVEASPDELREQMNLNLKVRDKISEGNTVLNALADIQAQVEGTLKRSQNATVQEQGKALLTRIAEIEEPLMVRGIKTRSEGLNHGTRLMAKMANLGPYIASADFAPTAAAYEHYDYVANLIDQQLAAYDTVLSAEVAGFNKAVADAGAVGVIA